MATTDDAGGHDYPPPKERHGTARTLSIVGFVLAGIAVLFAPLLFGLAAIVLGVIAHTKGDPLGRWVVAAGVAGALLGMLLIGLLLSASDDSALALLHR